MASIQRSNHGDGGRKRVTDEDFKVLCSVPLFSKLSLDSLRALVADDAVVLRKEDDILFSQGDEADAFYVLIKGWVKLFRYTQSGHELIVHVISPREAFAEAAIFDLQTYPVNAQCLSDVRLVKIKESAIKKLISGNMDIAFSMLSSMSCQLRRHLNVMHQLVSVSATERLGDFLLGLVDREKGPEVLVLPMDKAIIASKLGMRPETFSRSMKKLKPLGVTCQGREVHIEDTARLRQKLSNL